MLSPWTKINFFYIFFFEKNQFSKIKSRNDIFLFLLFIDKYYPILTINTIWFALSSIAFGTVQFEPPKRPILAYFWWFWAKIGVLEPYIEFLTFKTASIRSENLYLKLEFSMIYHNKTIKKEFKKNLNMKCLFYFF